MSYNVHIIKNQIRKIMKLHYTVTFYLNILHYMQDIFLLARARQLYTVIDKVSVHSQHIVHIKTSIPDTAE